MTDREIEDRVEELRAELCARAAGYWQLEPGRLVLRSFRPATDLPEAAARGFVEATRTVALDRMGLGIVQAIRQGAPAVSVAAELPADTGSGGWLRTFGACCSIAVPLADGSGRPAAVLAVALPERPEDPEATADRLRDLGASLVAGT